MKLSFGIICLFLMSHAFSQNVGIGTKTPAAKLSVGSTSQFQVDNTGNIQKINDIAYSFPYLQGTNGQVLMNDGTGQLNWNSVETIITLSPSNYLATVVKSNSYIKIDGVITLSQNYTNLDKDQLMITGGTINGDGISYLRLGDYVTFTGTTFNNIDIDGDDPTFINCRFLGNCPRVGTDARFLNCNFPGTVMGSSQGIGYIDHSTLSGCSIAILESVTNSDIRNCTIGNGNGSSAGLHTVSGCEIENSTLYALSSAFQFTNNHCEESRIVIGNSIQSARTVNISSNSFDGLLTGATEAIEIDPSYSFVKFLNIQNNIFKMSSTSPRSISVIANDGNSIRSKLNIQSNIFYRSSTPISYSSNMKVIYSQNVSSEVNHPSSTGNLIVANNY